MSRGKKYFPSHCPDMLAPDHIADLLFKYLRDELSGEDEIQLSRWRQISEYNEELFQRLTDPEQLRELLQGEYSKKKSWEKILAQAPELRDNTVAKKQWKWRFSVAAAVISILGITAVILAISFNYFAHKNKAPFAAAAVDSTNNYFHPGTDKAILTLSNGEKIILDSTKTRHDPRQLGNNIKELVNGKLLYKAALNVNGNEVFNTLETPRGGQFQLTLPDGSKVWLNAASSIRYPIAFSGSERKVEISGEAYFEVTKNERMPFIVSTHDTKVQVLGTHFNVNAYDDEPYTSVTLLEGSIKTIAGSNSKIIKPGEQAQIEKSNIHVVENLDINYAVSWKNGRTFFKNASIQYIMRIISRWYDIDVFYEGTISQNNITGGISRNANLSQLMTVLELNNIHFRIEGRKIIVLP